MKFILALTALVLIAASAAGAADPVATSTASQTRPWLSATDEHPYTQLFSVMVGQFKPAGIAVANSNFRYDYRGTSLNSYLVEPGWNIKLFHLLGSVYFGESLALSQFKANLANQGGASISTFLLGADTRVRHAWEWFPVRFIVPFIEGGYQYTFYSQSGPSDFESAQGSVGNFVAAAGIDLWINAMFGASHDAVTRYSAIPVFLTAKVNRVLSRGSDVDLGSTSVLAGLSVGL